MLDPPQQVDLGRLARVIRNLPCDIELPEEEEDFLAHRGLTRGMEPDRRKNARWHNRAIAGLMYLPTLPALNREKSWHRVYLLNLSQRGVGFLNREQLYPLEQLKLVLVDELSKRLLRRDTLRVIEITRCRRLQTRCYEVGARFIDAQSG
jgi:hypothetical protein